MCRRAGFPTRWPTAVLLAATGPLCLPITWRMWNHIASLSNSSPAYAAVATIPILGSPAAFILAHRFTRTKY